MISLDIGGGHSPEPGYVNVDPVHGSVPFNRKIEDLLPMIHDGEVEAIRASHVLEHVATEHRIAVMNEFWRLLQPGGELTVIVPVVPHWEAYADPTHISFWCPQSFAYFTKALVPQADYGILPWAETFHEETYDGHIFEWRGTPR